MTFGDILKIYEAIIAHYDGSSLPIAPEKQSGEFQAYCSKQLYHLNRRKGELKDFALSFAQAAHRLLVKSAIAPETANRRDLRQYTTLYVRVTTGDMDWQFDKLLELIDAGVFVLKGGPDVPRTKTRDSNPIQHFILTYRKLYGLASYIGLSNRDRFELSGKDLLAWLEDPASGAKILGRNLGLSEISEGEDQQLEDSEQPTSEIVNPSIDDPVPSENVQYQQMRMAVLPVEQGTGIPDDEQQRVQTAQNGSEFAHSESRLPIVTEINEIENELRPISTVITSLGFEDRTLTSAERLFSKLPQRQAVLVSYHEPGHADMIRAAARETALNVSELEYDQINRGSFELPAGEIMLDVTGLAKPAIFRLVAQTLSRDGTLVIAHTPAEVYYPLDEHIQPILTRDESDDMFTVLENARKIWTGEQGPYKYVALLNSDADQARPRVLCAAVSPQHERLLSLVEQRDYDGLCIIEPQEDSSRTRLAWLAAEVATQGRSAYRRDRTGSNDLIGTVKLIGNQFDEFYARNQFDIEFGLTGSKMHAVACAATSVVLKIAQCWYVQPAEFDPNRFTLGATETRFFRISLPGRVS